MAVLSTDGGIYMSVLVDVLQQTGTPLEVVSPDGGQQRASSHPGADAGSHAVACSR